MSYLWFLKSLIIFLARGESVNKTSSCSSYFISYDDLDDNPKLNSLNEPSLFRSSILLENYSLISSDIPSI